MEQQQNKHSSKNYKRNTKPAKLISNEYAIINKEDGILKANFNTIEEVKKYKEEHKEITIVYNIKVYKLNEKHIKLTQKI